MLDDLEQTIIGLISFIQPRKKIIKILYANIFYLDLYSRLYILAKNELLKCLITNFIMFACTNLKQEMVL